jgi:hypothetical protein
VDYNKILREEQNEERRGTTAVFEARWTAEKDERVRTGAKAEPVKVAVPSLSAEDRKTQV